MISVSIKSVGIDGRITFSIDDSIFTVVRGPRARLLDGNGAVLPCANFNEWFALRTMGFYTANHLYAMATAFKDGAATNVNRSELDDYADGIFQIIKSSLFRDGLAVHYIGQFPKCLLSRQEIERLVFSNGNKKDLVGICRARGYTDLTTRLERDGVIEPQESPITSDIGDLVIKSRIKKYIDGSR